MFRILILFTLIIATHSNLQAQVRAIVAGTPEEFAMRYRDGVRISEAIKMQAALIDEIGSHGMLENQGSSTGDPVLANSLRNIRNSDLRQKLSELYNYQLWLDLTELKKGQIGRPKNPDPYLIVVPGEIIQSTDKKITVRAGGVYLVISGMEKPEGTYFWIEKVFEVIGATEIQIDGKSVNATRLKVSPLAGRLERLRKQLIEDAAK